MQPDDREFLSRSVSSAADVLTQQKDFVLATRVNWRAFDGTYLRSEEVQLITDYDKSTADERAALLGGVAGARVVATLLHLLASLKQNDHVKYVLCLIDEILEDMPTASKKERVDLFLSLDDGRNGLPVAPLVGLLDIEDAYLQYLAAYEAGHLLFAQYERRGSCGDAGEALLGWAARTLRRADGRRDLQAQRAAVRCLQQILQIDGLRVRLSEMKGVDLLAGILSEQYRAVMEAKQELGSLLTPVGASAATTAAAPSSAGYTPVATSLAASTGSTAAAALTGRDLQLIYETLFCLWLLSFNATVAESGFAGTPVVLNTVRIIREVDKEKLRRVALAMLRNIGGKAQADEAMVHAGFWKVVQQFAQKRWGDDDISADVQVLQERMEAKMLDMTTWDRYKQELLSRQLEWSPPHKSETFWRENALRFNERDFELVGVLAALLDSPEPAVVAIACHDLGEFARFHPMGKRILTEHKIKTKIMTMIDAQDLTVQQQALLTLQKLMISNWEFVGK